MGPSIRMMRVGGRFRRLLWPAALLSLVTISRPVLSQIATAHDLSVVDTVQSADPLFADDTPLDLTLEFDFSSVLRDRAEVRDYQPAVVTYQSKEGDAVQLDLTVKTRGYYRLHLLNCDVPPLRLNFKKKQVGGTVFEGQDKIKLVTHCRRHSDSFQQYVLKEYLIYRMYNLLTERSFRVRLASITYVDSRGRDDPMRRYGFLIEDEDRMAERNDAELVTTEAAIHPEATDRKTMTLVSVFQYMIGNTDWGITTRHNTRLIYDRTTGALHAVPYDFDWAGLVDTPYAVPDPKLGIRHIRDRRFMGFCRSDEELRAVFAHIAQQEEAILALFNDFPHLEERHAGRASKYLREFFDSIRPPMRAARDISKECLR